MSSLFIPQKVLNEMLAHAREAHPYEACGILAGRAAGKDVKAERLFRITNIDMSEATYSMEPSEQMRATKEIKKSGLEMVAIYHSHPHSAPYPSNIDINRAFFPGSGPGPSSEINEENFPGVAYVIVGLAGEKPEVRVYFIEKKGVREIGLKTE